MGGYIGATGQDEVQEQFDILKDEIDANASYINTLVGIPDPTHLPFFGVNILNPGLYGLVERAEVNIKALQTQQGTSSTAISGIETSITGIEASITGIGGQITAVEGSISTIQFVELPLLSASIGTAAGVAADALVKANKSLGIWDESGNNVYHKKSGNVGIGITFADTLNNKLEVNGNINIPLSSNYKIGNQPLNYSHLAGTPPVSSKWTNATDTSTNIYYNTGNVGIGKTENIINKLEVGGNINIPLSSNYKINNQPLNYSHLAGTLSYNSLTDKLTQGTNITIVGNVINNTYTLPTAGVGTGGTLGGVKVDGTTITITNQVISAVAAQQVNSDWTETNTSLKSYIVNKPTAGANISFANNQIALSKSQDIELDSGANTRSYGWFNGSKLARVAVANSISTGSKVNDIVLKSTSNIRLQAGFFGSDDTSPPLLEAGIHIDAETNRVKMPHNVGIGTTPHATYKLDVNGTINSTNLLASGSVGIGTIASTIGYKLDVRGSILSDNIIGTSGTGFLFAGTTLSGLTRETIASVPIGFFELNDIILRGNNKIHLQSGNSTTIPPAITIGTTNNVGIGTTNPTTDTSVDIVKSTASGVSHNMLNTRFDSSWGLKLQQAYTGTGNIQYNFINRYNAVDYNSLTFKGASVGIGTSNPTTGYKLDVNGNVYAGNNSFLLSTYTGTSARQFFGKEYIGRIIAGMEIENTTLGGSYSQKLHFSTHHFASSEGRRMTIHEGGNISTSSSLSLGGGLTIPPDIGAITSGVGVRTYYLNNGASLYWGYGTANNHEFRNSANTTMFAISNTGSLTMKENVWHNDLAGYNRFYFGNNSTTYISGHGTDSCVEFRQNTNSMTARITNIGQWACHFRTIANSNTDDIGVNSNTSLDAVGYYFAHIIYNTFTGFHRCYYADDDIFNNDSSKEETDIFKNNYKGRIVISTGKIKTDLSRPVPKECKEEPNNNLEEPNNNLEEPNNNLEEPNINLAEPNNNLEEPNIDYTKPINCEQIDKENPNMEWYTAIDKDGITIEEAIPIVQLCRVKKDKRVYGVLGSPNRANNNKNRLIVNSLGEGAICVCNSNGNIENGDYIQSSDILGYGEKQDDDLLHNYSVAKAVMDCNFELDSPYYQCYELEGGVRVAFIACTYHCG
jgi:hypothetical protein